MLELPGNDLKGPANVTTSTSHTADTNFGNIISTTVKIFKCQIGGCILLKPICGVIFWSRKQNVRNTPLLYGETLAVCILGPLTTPKPRAQNQHFSLGREHYMYLRLWTKHLRIISNTLKYKCTPGSSNRYGRTHCLGQKSWCSKRCYD